MDPSFYVNCSTNFYYFWKLEVDGNILYVCLSMKVKVKSLSCV